MEVDYQTIDRDSAQSDNPSSLRRVLLDNSPISNPTLWLWINGICCAFSLGLLVEFTIFEDGPLDAINYGIPLYATYNFGTTIIWCAEEGLALLWEVNSSPSFDSLQRDRGKGLTVATHVVLLVAAVYFLVTSILFFYDMASRSPDEMEADTIDVFISFVFYLLAVLYMLWEIYGSSRVREPSLLTNVS